MKREPIRILAAVTIVCGLTTALAGFARANDLSTCITAQEATAFSLRHLQSRLMVAGLACNQRDAYNNFVEAFRPPLASAGASLIAYFQRSGGGQPALNRHVTELANVAGLYRAANPDGFCAETWTTFLALQKEPAALEGQALAHVMRDAGAPALCDAPAPPVQRPEITAEAGTVVKAAAEAPMPTD